MGPYLRSSASRRELASARRELQVRHCLSLRVHCSHISLEGSAFPCDAAELLVRERVAAFPCASAAVLCQRLMHFACGAADPGGPARGRVGGRGAGAADQPRPNCGRSGRARAAEAGRDRRRAHARKALPFRCSFAALSLPFHCPSAAFSLPFHFPFAALLLPFRCHFHRRSARLCGCHRSGPTCRSSTSSSGSVGRRRRRQRRRRRRLSSRYPANPSWPRPVCCVAPAQAPVDGDS